MTYYKKSVNNEIFIMGINKSGYSIASNLDPEPDTFTGSPWTNRSPGDWQECTLEDAEQILGYDPEEGSEGR